MPDAMILDKAIFDSWQVTFNSACEIEQEFTVPSYSKQNQKAVIPSILAQTIIAATLLTGTGGVVQIYPVTQPMLVSTNNSSGTSYKFKQSPNDNESDNGTTYISERDVNRNVDYRQVIEADTVRILSSNDILEISLTDIAYNDILETEDGFEVMALEEQLKQLTQDLRDLNKKLDGKVESFDKDLDAKFDKLEAKIEKSFDKLELKIDKLAEKISSINTDITIIKTHHGIEQTWKEKLKMPIITGLFVALFVVIANNLPAIFKALAGTAKP